MPTERQSLTHKFSIGGHEGYITGRRVKGRHRGRDLPDRHREGGLDDQGHDERVRDGDLDRPPVRRAIETFVRKFAYVRFEPEGITKNPEIPFAKSMPDYIMRWLASRWGDADLHEELGILTQEIRARKAAEASGRDTRRYRRP